MKEKKTIGRPGRKMGKGRKRTEIRTKRWTNQKQIEKRDRKRGEKGERKRMGEK